MRTSPTGIESRGRHASTARIRPDGFTLIEVLIVLTLVVVLTAVLAPIMFPSAGRVLSGTASELTTTLRETRRHARAANQRRRFLVDTESRRYGIEDSPAWKTLPREMTVELTTAESLVTDDSRGGIDFFPDGSSTGGRVVLGLGGQMVQVDIEWLTGRIEISRTGQ